jgi:AraC family transcriptional regulator
MDSNRIYGDVIAHSHGLDSASTVITQSLRTSQIGISKLSWSFNKLGKSSPIPQEDTFIVAIYLTVVSHHELWSRGRSVISQGYAANSMRIVNLIDEVSAYTAEPHEALVFYIPRTALDEFADEAGGRRITNLACTAGIIDPVIAHLGTALLPACDRPQEAKALFVDHVTLAICAHLAHVYGGFRLHRTDLKGALTTGREKRAKALLASACDGNISLANVARECGLSRGYFIKAFRATTGLTPHQWLQRFRVDKAKSMLLHSSAPVAQIAVACGFADQSHLTRVFTHLVGDSPAAWRRQRQA